ncbi:hypothetical protein A6U89_31725 [Agrobacterium sp. B133/95]|nr:hypothetical protein A6U89_31725 [Agrobacterium sp. B133/95]
MIVLRGDLAAILTFASGKKKLEFLNEKAILEALMGRARTIEGQKRKKPAMRAFGYWHFGKIGFGGQALPRSLLRTVQWAVRPSFARARLTLQVMVRRPTSYHRQRR